MCSVFSEAIGEDPCGSAPIWDHCLIVEFPTPWEHEVTDSPGFPAGIADLLEQRLDVRLQVIQPDDMYSVEGHSRVILFSRPDGPVRDLVRKEYLVPSERLLDTVSTVLGYDGEELGEWEQHNNGMRDLLVCTHGTRDICCASTGQPTYMELQSRYSNSHTRVWRLSHTGGHRLAPIVIDMPSGRYWSRLTPPRALQLGGYSGDVTDLYDCYRGWPAIASPRAQLVEREAFMREGWDWTGRQVESEVIETSDDGMEERVVLRSRDSDGGLTSYEAVVRQSGVVQSIECLSDTFAKEYPQYELVSFEVVGP
jgi:hypothetical protein